MASIVVQDEGCYFVEGELIFDTVVQLSDKAKGFFSGATGAVVIDLSGVTRTDSAGLALVVDWMRNARSAGLTVSFRQVPEQLLAIARVSRFDKLIPLADA